MYDTMFVDRLSWRGTGFDLREKRGDKSGSLLRAIKLKDPCHLQSPPNKDAK